MKESCLGWRRAIAGEGELPQVEGSCLRLRGAITGEEGR